MLTIFCGEDIEKARTKFNEFINNEKIKGFKLHHIKSDEVLNILKNDEGVFDLFGNQLLYQSEYISKKYKGRVKDEYKEAIQKISLSKNVNLISWEGGLSAYDLSTIKKITTNFFESKPSKSIFELLDLIYPGNLNAFLATLEIILPITEELFIYTMIRQHIRKLHHFAEGVIDNKTPPWQKIKIKNQALKWEKHKLKKFYEKLLNIDVTIRTGETTYNYMESIKLLVCYYLK